MATSLEQLFDELWTDYRATNPKVEAIRNLLGGPAVVNDHVAFRGLALPGLGIDALAAPFVELGYTPADTYSFAAKRLFARHYDPPEATRPKVFISELLVEELAEPAQNVLRRLADRVDIPRDRPLCLAGRVWPAPSRAEYDTLLTESEYAAWMAAFGFRVNHFTVAVHALAGAPSLQMVNARLEAEGYPLNTSGGAIKGRPEMGLEQSSTLAEPIVVSLADGEHVLPGVYYEFARRHPVQGQLFGGFIADNANHIFESTDARR